MKNECRTIYRAIFSEAVRRNWYFEYLATLSQDYLAELQDTQWYGTSRSLSLSTALARA